MRLYKNNLYVFIVLFAGVSCATSTYKIKNSTDHRVELLVTPDRIVLQCDEITDGDWPGMFGFLIYILDDQKTVTTVAQTNVLDEEGCYDRFNRITKILKHGHQITIGGLGSINEPRIVEKWRYHFPKWGTYATNGRSLQFIVISNEQGECYGAYHGPTPPCSAGQFPIR
jgi:hypothetical protein